MNIQIPWTSTSSIYSNPNTKLLTIKRHNVDLYMFSEIEFVARICAEFDIGTDTNEIVLNRVMAVYLQALVRCIERRFKNGTISIVDKIYIYNLQNQTKMLGESTFAYLVPIPNSGKNTQTPNTTAAGETDIADNSNFIITQSSVDFLCDSTNNFFAQSGAPPLPGDTDETLKPLYALYLFVDIDYIRKMFWSVFIEYQRLVDSNLRMSFTSPILLHSSNFARMSFDAAVTMHSNNRTYVQSFETNGPFSTANVDRIKTVPTKTCSSASTSCVENGAGSQTMFKVIQTLNRNNLWPPEKDQLDNDLLHRNQTSADTLGTVLTDEERVAVLKNHLFAMVFLNYDKIRAIIIEGILNRYSGSPQSNVHPVNISQICGLLKVSRTAEHQQSKQPPPVSKPTSATAAMGEKPMDGPTRGVKRKKYM